MSGNLGFITTNPVGVGFDRMQRTLDDQERRDDERQRRQEERQVDQAIRSGLGEISVQQAQVPVQQQRPPTQQAAAAAQPPMRLDDRSAFRAALGSIEDPSGQAINPYGFTGRYQFGAPALHAAGMYQPAAGERLNANEWRGTIVLPDGRRMTREQFQRDQQAQEVAFDQHQKNLDREIAARGLDRYIGTRVMDQPIDRASLYALMHHGGPEGTARFLRSGGVYDPADANGMRMSTYAKEVQRRMAAGAGMPAPQGQPMAQTSGGPMSYGPIIQRLAQTPGGGRTGLQLVGADMAGARTDQVRADRLSRDDLNRRDEMEQRALQALARGQIDVGRYLLQQSGSTLPPEVTANMETTQRFAQGATMARSVYGNDRAGAARFVREYLKTNDPAAALSAAGDPAGQSAGRVQWMDDGTGRAVGILVDPTTGQSRPITDHEGNPVIRAPGQGQQGRVADRELRLRMLRTAGYSEQDANAIAGGATPSANSMVSAYGRVMRMVADDFSIPDNKKQARVDEIMYGMFGEGWQDRLRGRAPGTPAAETLPVPPLPPAPVDRGRTPTITNDAEYQALPPGTIFIGPDGKRRQKP